MIPRPGIAVDGDGRVYVTGYDSGNAFKMTTAGVITEITEIIDETGDGAGNTLISPTAIAVDGEGKAYVTAWSDNGFKID